MSTTLAPTPIALVPHKTTHAIAKPIKRWLVSPWFDLLFLANLAWPVAVLLALLRPLDDSNPLSLFQVYFLSTPHRWITIVLVFCDSDRFWKEPAKFGGVGIGLVLLGLGLVAAAGLVPNLAGPLTLLMMVDYVWNAWHFAAQHAGIARIYGRMVRPEQSLPHAEFEKMALRTLVLWMFFRLAVHMASMSEYAASVSWLAPWLPWVDPFALLLPAVLLYREATAYRPGNLGRILYIGSVFAALHGPVDGAAGELHELDGRALFCRRDLSCGRISGDLQLVGAEANHRHLALPGHAHRPRRRHVHGDPWCGQLLRQRPVGVRVATRHAAGVAAALCV